MRFSLIPKEMKFFALFEEATARIVSGSAKLEEMAVQFDNLSARALAIKADEEACDVTVEKIIKALDRSFITPFDREDIHSLATSLDDVMDNVEEASHRFESFRIDRPTPEAIELVKIIRKSCEHLQGAVPLLRDLRKSEQIQSHLREIGVLENHADRLYRKVDSDLFASNPSTPADVLNLIKWRELYAWLEQTVDSAKSVSQIISEIVIKGT